MVFVFFMVAEAPENVRFVVVPKSQKVPLPVVVMTLLPRVRLLIFELLEENEVQEMD